MQPGRDNSTYFVAAGLHLAVAGWEGVSMRWVASVRTPDGLESDDGRWLIVPVRSFKVPGIVAWLLAPLPIELVEAKKPKRFNTLKEAKEATEGNSAGTKGGA